MYSSFTVVSTPSPRMRTPPAASREPARSSDSKRTSSATAPTAIFAAVIHPTAKTASTQKMIPALFITSS